MKKREIMIRINKLVILSLLLFITPAFASVIPEYASNTYTKRSPNRSEKKCMDEGFTITYENCSQMNAPTDPCPYHQDYYKSCSQEQWCKNHNFTLKPEDCKLPSFPIKACDNGAKMYRACQEDIKRACMDMKYEHQSSCQLTPERCPYSQEYGACCTPCEGFAHDINNIPDGYVADGPTCINCDNVTKTNVIENPCEGYIHCDFGPELNNTPSCKQGKKMLYKTCKTAEIYCQEKGYTQSTCSSTEDVEVCPEFTDLVKCNLNCFKLVKEQNPTADIINENITDPVLDISKDVLMSMYGKMSESCVSDFRPEITLNLNVKNMKMYENILNRKISNMIINLNFIDPIELTANGEFNNVRIKINGEPGECALKGRKINVTGTFNVSGATNICADINIENDGKFITSGNVQGNIDLGKNASLGIKGNLFGYLKSGTYSEALIKGIVKYKDNANDSFDNAGILLGCGSKTKISGGIVTETANVVLKQRAQLDTPYIKMISTSDNPDLPNTLSSIHIHKGGKVVSVYDSSEYSLASNNDNINCDDNYILHLGSAVNKEAQAINLEPSQLLEDKWKCRTLDRKLLDCN